MEATFIGEGTMEMEEAVFPCKGCGEVATASPQCILSALTYF